MSGGFILLRRLFLIRAPSYSLVFSLNSRVLSTALVLFLAFFHSVNAEPLRIAIVYGESGGAYQEFIEAFQGNVAIRHKVRANRDNDPIGDDVDLVIAVGMKAATSRATQDRPVLNVFVPRAGFEKLQRAPSPTFSAIFMDQPIQRQLALITSALPKSTSIGVLYATPSAELDSLRKLTAAISLDLNEQLVDKQHPLAGALSDLLRVSDVLLVLPDTEVYRSDTIRNILFETYRTQVPMVGISPGYVRAGALCAIYSTPQQIARQAADAVEQFAISGTLPATQYTKEFEVSVNTQVARSLGLHIKDAEQLRLEVGRKQ